MKIFIEGEAHVREDEDHQPIDNSNKLVRITGRIADVNLADAFWPEDDLEMFKGGVCSFIFNNDDRQLWTQTVYETVDKNYIPQADELARLVGHTSGQWSDGWGKCLEQMKFRGYYISPRPREQQIRIRVE